MMNKAKAYQNTADLASSSLKGRIALTRHVNAHFLMTNGKGSFVLCLSTEIMHFLGKFFVTYVWNDEAIYKNKEEEKK